MVKILGVFLVSWLSSYFTDIVNYEEYVGRDTKFNTPIYKEGSLLVCKLLKKSEVYIKNDTEFSSKKAYSIITDTAITVGSLIGGQNVTEVERIALFNGDVVYRAVVGGSSG